VTTGVDIYNGGHLPRQPGEKGTAWRKGDSLAVLFSPSWTVVPRCSRQWMSGHAAFALAERRDRGPFVTTAQIMLAPGEPFSPLQGNLRFPLTFTYHGCPRFSTPALIPYNVPVYPGARCPLFPEGCQTGRTMPPVELIES
jgi:hypothetical protein